MTDFHFMAQYDNAGKVELKEITIDYCGDDFASALDAARIIANQERNGRKVLKVEQVVWHGCTDQRKFTPDTSEPTNLNRQVRCDKCQVKFEDYAKFLDHLDKLYPELSSWNNFAIREVTVQYNLKLPMTRHSWNRLARRDIIDLINKGYLQEVMSTSGPKKGKMILVPTVKLPVQAPPFISTLREQARAVEAGSVDDVIHSSIRGAVAIGLYVGMDMPPSEEGKRAAAFFLKNLPDPLPAGSPLRGDPPNYEEWLARFYDFELALDRDDSLETRDPTKFTVVWYKHPSIPGRRIVAENIPTLEEAKNIADAWRVSHAVYKISIMREGKEVWTA